MFGDLLVKNKSDGFVEIIMHCYPLSIFNDRIEN